MSIDRLNHPLATRPWGSHAIPTPTLTLAVRALATAFLVVVGVCVVLWWIGSGEP